MDSLSLRLRGLRGYGKGDSIDILQACSLLAQHSIKIPCVIRTNGGFSRGALLFGLFGFYGRVHVKPFSEIDVPAIHAAEVHPPFSAPDIKPLSAEALHIWKRALGMACADRNPLIVLCHSRLSAERA